MGHTVLAMGLISKQDKDRGIHWACDGRDGKGCKTGSLNCFDFDAVNRFRCSVCDFDICERCFLGGAVSTITSTGENTKEMSVMGLKAPTHWDMSAMRRITRAGGLDMTSGTHNYFAQIPLKPKELEDIQALLDSSFRKVYTRDRKGAKVPDGLKLEKGFRIQNAEDWIEFEKSEERIRNKLRALKKATMKINDTVKDLKTGGFLK